MGVVLYVLESRDSGRRYVGITNDLARRLRERSSVRTKAGHLLRGFVVLHTEGFADHVTARKREQFLKSGQGRKWLDELEAGSWPAEGG